MPRKIKRVVSTLLVAFLLVFMLSPQPTHVSADDDPTPTPTRESPDPCGPGC